MFTKNELREKALQIRRLLEIDKISDKIVQNVIGSDIYQNANNIMIFYPLKDEINLLPLLNDKTYGVKNYYLPRVNGDELVICSYKDGDVLTKSQFNTMEPLTEPINPDILDLIFVPALMVDKNFNRLGYGKGFYDRFLSKSALNAIRIVPIPSLLIKENIPTDEFDSPIDIILDEL